MGELAQRLMALFTSFGLDKNAAISATIKTMTDQGISIPVAYEEVFGAGSYREMKVTLHGMIVAPAPVA